MVGGGALVYQRCSEAGEPVAQQGFIWRVLPQVDVLVLHAALVEDFACLAHAVAGGDAVKFHHDF